MKLKILPLLIIALSFFSLKDNRAKIIEGDLTFQSVDLFRLFDQPDSIITDLEMKIKSIDFDTLSNADKKDFEIWNYAMDNNLLRTPYVRLRNKKGESVMLFMDYKNYNFFEKLKCHELRRDSVKIHVFAEVENISFKRIKAFKLTGQLETEKISGIIGCGK